MKDTDGDLLSEFSVCQVPHCKVTFSFFYSVLWKGVTMCSLYLRNGSYTPSPWGQGIYINYLEFLCSDLSILPWLFIKPFYLYRPRYLLYNWDYNLLLFVYFSAHIVPGLTIESSLSYLTPPFFCVLNILAL